MEVVASLSLKVAQPLRSAACLHTNQSRSYLNHFVHKLLICHNSVRTKKFGIFELLVQKETFADAFLKGVVSQRSFQNSPLENSCVIIAPIENYSTSKPLKFSPVESQILSCDTVVANEIYMEK